MNTPSLGEPRLKSPLRRAVSDDVRIPERIELGAPPGLQFELAGPRSQLYFDPRQTRAGIVTLSSRLGRDIAHYGYIGLVEVTPAVDDGLRPVHPPELTEHLGWVLEAVLAEGAEPWVHSCAPETPYDASASYLEPPATTPLSMPVAAAAVADDE